MLRKALRRGKLLRRAAAPRGTRSYQFASTEYNDCFGNVPIVDVKKLRMSAIDALKRHEENDKLWYDDPVVTIVNGSSLADGPRESTTDAFGNENGHIIMATEKDIDNIIEHLSSFESKGDYRSSVRDVEAELLETRAGDLIANQAVDFKKQDGVTEIEESIEANLVEQRMNDLLLRDEADGKITISRAPVFVGCVSNFSNFLDLCRKVLRHMELGIPCVVLSRPNTTQHMFRWTQMLLDIMVKHNVDNGLLTYATCTIPQTHRLFDTFPNGPMHITCNREVAANVRAVHANTLSSTGGPNTLVSTEATPEVMQAIRWSAMIENSGQCTALRHAVINTDESTVRSMFDDSKAVSSSAESLEKHEFANVFENYPFETLEGYTIHRPSHGQPCAYRISDELPPDSLSEQWRQVYVDVTTPKEAVGSDDTFVASVAKWLVRNQPISLAVNGSYDMALDLFEQTGQVVYTVGGTKEHVALTAQARPQDGEVFGEFPVRKELFKYTKYPMIIPSPPAAYNSTYSLSFLEGKGQAAKAKSGTSVPSKLLDNVASDVVRGYMQVLWDYLADACGPRTGWRTGTDDARTALYGLQRPPLNGQKSVVRCDASISFERVAPILFPFVATNASDQMYVSCDPSNAAALKVLSELNIPVKEQSDAEFSKDVDENADDLYNVIDPSVLSLTEDESAEYPLAAQFISLWFPVGHVKSAKPNDGAFLQKFSASDKWLTCRRGE